MYRDNFDVELVCLLNSATTSNWSVDDMILNKLLVFTIYVTKIEQVEDIVIETFRNAVISYYRNVTYTEIISWNIVVE